MGTIEDPSPRIPPTKIPIAPQVKYGTLIASIRALPYSITAGSEEYMPSSGFAARYAPTPSTRPTPVTRIIHCQITLFTRSIFFAP